MRPSTLGSDNIRSPWFFYWLWLSSHEITIYNQGSGFPDVPYRFYHIFRSHFARISMLTINTLYTWFCTPNIGIAYKFTYKLSLYSEIPAMSSELANRVTRAVCLTRTGTTLMCVLVWATTLCQDGTCPCPMVAERHAHPIIPFTYLQHVRDLIQYLQNSMLTPCSTSPAYREYVFSFDTCRTIYSCRLLLRKYVISSDTCRTAC